MCGIVGVVTKHTNGFSKKQEDAFYQMLFADTLRGDDSTGMILVEKDSSFGIMKEAAGAPYVIDSMRNSRMGKDMIFQGKALIGHNRAATRGAVVAENAHPFVVDNVFALVHNGTLYGHKELSDTTVDSEALAIHLKDVLGSHDKAKLEEELGKVYGAYAIAAFHQEANKVFLTRNKERPLAIVETDDGWFWASEHGLLAWILSRNGYDFSKMKAEFIKEDVLYTFDLDKNTLVKEEYVPKKAVVLPTVTKSIGPVMVGPTATTGRATAATSKVGLSKNEFKRYKKRLLYTTTTFYADDYVEKNFPATLEKGETEVLLFGESDDARFPFEHQVNAEFNLKSLGIPYDTFLERIYQGRIVDMKFNARTKQVMIYLDRVSAIPKSGTYGPAELAADLDRKEKLALRQALDKLIEEADENPATVH